MGTILTDDVLDEAVVAEAAGGSDEADASGADAAARSVHRLRDLDRRGRVLAGLLALALLLAPVLAFAWAAPDWVPTGDIAFMGLRALDVGTSRTPLIGQPSSSAFYIDGDVVNHLGPTHFYLLAPAMRVFGNAIGMLVVSLLITGSCVLIAAWATFRQLGARGGALAAVVLGAITFTTGASSLVNPVSSSISGYPLLCSMILLFCLLCGDLRLLPLTVGVASFAAQQHLSVVPGLVVATSGVVAIAVGLSFLRRRGLVNRTEPELAPHGEGGSDGGSDATEVDPAANGETEPAALARARSLVDLVRPSAELVRFGALSAAVVIVVWSPVLVQQLFGNEPNLSSLVTFARHDERPSLGPRLAIRPVIHVLGLPPLLGKRELDGFWLLGDPTALNWVSAALVVLVATGLGWRWRRARPRQAALAVMVGVLSMAGWINGSSVPVGVEQFRIPFYHWAFALAFFVAMTLGSAGLDLLAERSPLARRAWAGSLGACAAVLAVALPSLVNPSLDRSTNTLRVAYSPVERSVMDTLTDEILAHRDELGDSMVMVARGDDLWPGIAQGLSLALTAHGLPVLHPVSQINFVDDEWLAKRRAVDGSLVVVVEQYDEPEIVVDSQPVLAAKEPIAEVDPFAEVDQEAFDQLVDEARGVTEVRLGADAQAAVKETNDVSAAYYSFTLPRLASADASTLLRNRDLLEFLRDHPLDAPRLDPELIDRVLDTLPPATRPFHIRVYALDQAETVVFAPYELGR